MKRDIYLKLEEWKKSPRRKPLILNGARQVGKTYALKHFGKASYTKVAYLNFEKDEKLAGYFQETLEPKKLIQILGIHTGIEIEPQSTLLIFDEIQECPKALNSLKYFCEEANEYHIAAAGSLLGVKTANEKGFPVGKVNFLHLYPLSFFEFLSATNNEQMRAFLEQCKIFDPLPGPLHEKLVQLLKLYLFIGGMPEAVAEYIQHEKLNIVREVQTEILSAYEKDFAKHAPPHEIMKITTVWQQIHRQLAKENKKFIFAAIRKSARGRDYEEAIQWLCDAGLIYKNHLVDWAARAQSRPLRAELAELSCEGDAKQSRLTQEESPALQAGVLQTPRLPLSAYADNTTFKIFLVDVGLLGAQSNLSLQAVIEGNNLFTEFKGALTENYVAQELIASTQKELYYWASEGTAELDFLVQGEHEIYPLEVKAGSSQKKKSLLVYGEKYSPSKLTRATLMNLKHDGDIYNYPLYMVCRFPNL